MGKRRHLMLVDIHNHILPGLDDGPSNWEEALFLAKQAVETGISHVIATPHHKHQHKHHFYENNPDNIKRLVDEANKLLAEHQIPLTIYPGIEFHVHDTILEDIKQRPETFLTLNCTGKYMLMELPCHHLPEHTDETLKMLQKMGMAPVIAHPERNRILRKDPSIIYNWIQNGILVQLTAGSITGKHGKRLKNFSLHLLDHDLVHFVASDAHHYLRRKFELASSYELINTNFSSDYTKNLQENALQLLAGKPLKIRNPQMIGKRRQYFFFYNHPLNQKV